jgi:VanZ family protein
MLTIFSPDSPYKKQARYLAMLWTLLIFVGCFMPAKNIPKVDAPLIDKWVHFVLFGGFTFLWLCSRPSLKRSWLVTILIIGIALGSTVELLQGALPSLGRACELLDAVADSLGSLLGVLLFWLLASIGKK